MGLTIYEYKRHCAVAGWEPDPTEEPGIVRIPKLYHNKPVTEILHGAFSGKLSIERVVIPTSLQVIGTSAFEGCLRLKIVSPNESSTQSTLPEAVVAIEERAFFDTGLAGVLNILGKHVQIKDAAFEACTSLTGCVIGSDTLKLGKRAYYGCSNLEFVIGNAKMETVPEEAFSMCVSLKQMGLPFHSVSARAFWGDGKLAQIKALPTLRHDHIGEDAFTGCNSLSGIPRTERGDDMAMNIEENKAQATFPAEYYQEHSFCSELDIKYLFRLKLPHTNDPGEFPWRIKGRFESICGYRFQGILPAKFAYEYECIEEEKLRDIIKLLACENWQVYLYGKRYSHYFEVYDIQLAGTASKTPLLNHDFFHEVIRRNLLSDGHETKTAEEKKHYYLKSKEEFEVFLKVCGESTLPEWVRKAAHKEMAVLENARSKFDPNADHAMAALEILLNVDWEPSLKEIPSIHQAKEILDQSFYGLDSVKQPFLELIAQINRTKKLPKQSNILLVGPPGVGKTYITKVMSRLLNLPVVHLNFSSIGQGGDEISGSNRIYSNAKPGTILQGYLNHRTTAILLFVDELDKAQGQDSSLLSILDGAGYAEGFLEQRLPTNNIYTIASANSLDNISEPLRSRFRVVHIDPYSFQEKEQIWRLHALPKALAEMELPGDAISFTTDAEKMLIKNYATDPGARDLYDLAKRIARKYCYELAFHPEYGPKCHTCEDIRTILGPGKCISRPFIVHPGAVRFAYPFQGRVIQSTLEVTVDKGSGKLEILGVVSSALRQYIRTAWKAVGNTSRFDLHNSDITVFIPKAIQSSENIVGMPVYVAICLALLQTSANLSKICTIGSGVDLFGNIYLDSGLPGKALLNLVEEERIQMLYGPPGFSAQLDLSQVTNPPLIVESLDGESLVRMVIANSQQLLEK